MNNVWVVWEVWDGDLFLTYAYSLEEAHLYWEAGFEIIEVVQKEDDA